MFGDIQHDERFGEGLLEVLRRLNIRAMAMLPLWAGMQQRGALLLQAEDVYQLSEAELRPYIALMAQVAVAVENRRLLAETNAALTEAESIQRRYTVQSWEMYRTGKVAQNYEQVREGMALTAGSAPIEHLSGPDGWLEDNGHHPVPPANNYPVGASSDLEIPLTIRDEVVGLLGLQESYPRQWTPDENTLIKAVAEQLAQAFENLRLIDETQQQAARETRISEIGERIRSAQSLEEALQIAIREVGRSLAVPETLVKLEVSDS